MNAYFKGIKDGISTTLVGMKLTMRHLWAARYRRRENNVRDSDYFFEDTGMVTLQYPFETMPIPDNGRYRLHNEMDDCIVCDKCAKICPVDCIEIEPIRATGEIGQASDGSPIRLYAAKFDIDMAKCCYCGLCTTVCPTECLTMTKTFDYSEFDIREMLYNFTNLTPEQAEEKKLLWEQYLLEKEEFKKNTEVQKAELEVVVAEVAKRPAFKPKAKPAPVAAAPLETTPEEIVPENVGETAKIENEIAEIPKPKPVFRPTKKSVDTVVNAAPAEEIAAPELLFEEKKSGEEPAVAPTRSEPVFRPTMKPKE